MIVTFDFDYIDNGLPCHFFGELDLCFEYDFEEGHGVIRDCLGDVSFAPAPDSINIEDWDFESNIIEFVLTVNDEEKEEVWDLSKTSYWDKYKLKLLLEDHIDYKWVEEKLLEQLGD